MAKKKKTDTTAAFSIQGFDMTHYRRTEAYTAAIENFYAKATTEITNAVASGTYDPDKPFAFSDYPRIASYVKQVMTKLASNVQAVISKGSRREWLFACRKNDEFIKSIMDTAKLTKKRLEKMQDRNLDALKSFQTRKVEGLDLSQRVWKYTDQYRAQLELGLDVGLGEGRSAQQLARDVKQNLKYPDKLFRRVRDKRGNLQLSKAAKAFHPGTGVYRSSVKNAQRLTRSEINMAYRESDYLRWQQLDFVVGFDVHRSNHEPLCKCDLCAQLVGRYPKTFKFKGWHPQCMCYATPVLMDDDMFDANELGDLKAALRGTSYRHLEAKNAVTDVPDNFKEWVESHKEQQQGWKSVPYFIRDNFVDGNMSLGLKESLTDGIVKTIMQAVAVTAPKNPAVKYVLDDPAMTYEDRAKNYVDIISAMYGSKGNYPGGAAYKKFFDRVKSEYKDYVLLKKTLPSPDRYLDMYIIKPVNVNLGYGMGEHFDAVRHLEELSSAKDLDKIPSMWRSRFNECIKKIDALDAMTDGYVTVYREIEEAYNIYKLSTNKMAVEYGLEKISPKMPAGLFDIAKKIGYNLADHMPKKDFFDSLDKYVPLSLKGMKEETCYYSPTFKFVRLPINVADVKGNFSDSKIFRTKIVYHEFGHARADMSDTEKWEDSKEWNDLFDKYEALINKKTAAEYVKVFNGKEAALNKDGKLSKDDANSLGALSDTIQALVKDHGYVWHWGHSPSYFSKRDNQLAEFIAHASENYWGGNALFKELSPDLYKDMCELVKKMVGKRTGAGKAGTPTTSPSPDRKEDSMESVRSQRRELLVNAQKLVNQTITVPDLKHPVLITKTSVKEWLNQPHRHLQEKNAMIMDIAGILKKSRYVGAVPDRHDSRVTAHLFETVVGGEKSYIIVRELGNGEFRLHSISDSSKLAELAKKK